MRKYYVYIDDGKDVFREEVAAKSSKAAKEAVKGNGDVVAVKDVTAEHIIDIGRIRQALKSAEFSAFETEFIAGCLSELDCKIKE